MRNIIYFLLALTLVVVVVSVVQITALLKNDTNDGAGVYGIMGLAPGVKQANAQESNSKETTRKEDGKDSFLAKLPCFKCHKMDAWEGEEGKGEFPHIFHIQLKLHCLDCHTFVAHGEGMKVALDTCTRCHG